MLLAGNRKNHGPIPEAGKKFSGVQTGSGAQLASRSVIAGGYFHACKAAGLGSKANHYCHRVLMLGMIGATHPLLHMPTQRVKEPYILCVCVCV